MSNWEVKTEIQRKLLGSPPKSTFYRWKTSLNGRLTLKQMTRVSYILTIHNSLITLLPDINNAHAWVQKPNSYALFKGKSALGYMSIGYMTRLKRVSDYVRGECI